MPSCDPPAHEPADRPIQGPREQDCRAARARPARRRSPARKRAQRPWRPCPPAHLTACGRHLAVARPQHLWPRSQASARGARDQPKQQDGRSDERTRAAPPARPEAGHPAVPSRHAESGRAPGASSPATAAAASPAAEQPLTQHPSPRAHRPAGAGAKKSSAPPPKRAGRGASPHPPHPPLQLPTRATRAAPGRHTHSTRSLTPSLPTPPQPPHSPRGCARRAPCGAARRRRAKARALGWGREEVPHDARRE